MNGHWESPRPSGYLNDISIDVDEAFVAVPAAVLIPGSEAVCPKLLFAPFDSFLLTAVDAFGIFVMVVWPGEDHGKRWYRMRPESSLSLVWSMVYSCSPLHLVG